jgi:hypothetical protein
MSKYNVDPTTGAVTTKGNPDAEPGSDSAVPAGMTEQEYSYFTFQKIVAGELRPGKSPLWPVDAERPLSYEQYKAMPAASAAAGDPTPVKQFYAAVADALAKFVAATS